MPASARALCLALAALLIALAHTPAQAQPGGSVRQLIQSCWQRGAFNEFLMFQCTGRPVPPPVFQSCMNGGPCFGETGAQGGPIGQSGPACGAYGLTPCPQPSPCGFTNTIACPPPPGFPFPPFPVAAACGTPPFPICNAPQPCGAPNTYACSPPPPIAGGGNMLPPPGFGTWQPTLQVALPTFQSPDSGQFNSEVKFATPPIPNLAVLKSCRADASDEDEFMSCMVEKAMPPAYRMTKHCLEENEDDPAAALLCSTGNSDLQKKYERVKEVQSCAEDASNNAEVAECLSKPFLGSNERYYANCLAKNADSASAAVVCALAKDLTPEQQIALNCAMTTGGQPYAFAACTGGQLATREINKCWENGIATDKGCFGPNNEIRKFWNGVDGTLRTAIGENNELYKAFVLYKDNVIAPGPNHEFVRAANTVINDVRNGPGPNNDIVKAGRAIGGGLQSVGNAVGNAIGIKF